LSHNFKRIADLKRELKSPSRKPTSEHGVYKDYTKRPIAISRTEIEPTTFSTSNCGGGSKTIFNFTGFPTFLSSLHGLHQDGIKRIFSESVAILRKIYCKDAIIAFAYLE
jgi:hypothetical protein